MSDTLPPVPAFVCVCVYQAGRCVVAHISNTCPLTSVLMPSLSCGEGPLTYKTLAWTSVVTVMIILFTYRYAVSTFNNLEHLFCVCILFLAQ